MNTIEQLYQEWQSLQPLKPEDQKRLDQKFMLEFNYNSNHIEGNTLTYGQTKLLFMFGETSGSANLRDYEEMKAHNVGLEMMKCEAADKERPLSETFIREMNRTILVENFWKNALTATGEATRMEVQVGVYKTRKNSVVTATGEIFDYVSPQETPAFMTDLVNWYNEEERKGELSPIELAALLHYRYIRIHPFEDGNGRIARLLVNYVLHRHGYPMIVVRSDKEHKDEYLRILHQCDVEVGLTPSEGALSPIEKIQPFVAYMEAQLQRALEISIKAAKGESIEEEDDFKKQLTLLEKEAKQKTTEKEELIWNVLEFFYFPLVKRIELILNEVKPFFTHSEDWNAISKSEASCDDALLVNFITRKTANAETKNYVRAAKYIEFHHELSLPKDGLISDRDFSVAIDFQILFKDEYYHVSALSKDYAYQLYPSEEDIRKIVSDTKEKILLDIKNAIHES